MTSGRWKKLRGWVEPRLALTAHHWQLLRLRAERLAASLAGRRARPRVLATACWDFPIYSQTFVYQELTQLIRRGFTVRFLYSNLTSRAQLPSQFSPLWRARRRAILHSGVGAHELASYTRRMPEKLAALVGVLSRASGLSPEEVRGHHHFLHACAFTRTVEAYRPDYLHSYFFYEGTLFAFCASYLLGIPRGVSCYADHMLQDYPLKLVPLHLEQCSLVVATSARIKRELMAIHPGADSGRILVKPNAINASRFPVPTRAEPRNGDPYRLVCVSRIEPKKGIIYLVEAVGALRQKGLAVELHLLGGVDNSPAHQEYAATVAARLRELELGGLVHLEGRKSEAEINAVFARSHLYVAPFIETDTGDKDGIPTSLLEGMASGLPVVATDAGSITEVIEDGESGVLTAQRDPVELGNAIEALLRDPSRRDRLGRGAAERIRQHFDVEVCEGSFHERLRRVIGRDSPART